MQRRHWVLFVLIKLENFLNDKWILQESQKENPYPGISNERIGREILQEVIWGDASDELR